MKKTLIIIGREFSTRVHKRSFIILTILMPFLLAALIIGPLWLAKIKDNKTLQVVVIDATGRYADCLTDAQGYHFVRAERMKSAYRQKNSGTDAVVMVGREVNGVPSVTISSPREVPLSLRDYVQDKLQERVRQNKLLASGIANTARVLRELQTQVPVQTYKWNEAGEESLSNTDVAVAAAFLLTFLIYSFVMSYGGMVMQGVSEEKGNRIVEVIVSSVKPTQLMMGKIVGVALVGLMQLLIWGVMLAVILGVGMALLGADAGALAQTTTVSTPTGSLPAELPQESAKLMEALLGLPYFEMTVMFVLLFIGGYLLYAAFFAAVGASVNTQEDSSQFMLPVIIVMIFALYAAIYSIDNTDGPLAFWTSIIPITSPVVMMVRIPFGVPLWQEVLSLVLLYASAFLFIWVGAKIYRTGIFMYGKKPSLREMARWLRYK